MTSSIRKISVHAIRAAAAVVLSLGAASLASAERSSFSPVTVRDEAAAGVLAGQLRGQMAIWGLAPEFIDRFMAAAAHQDPDTGLTSRWFADLGAGFQEKVAFQQMLRSYRELSARSVALDDDATGTAPVAPQGHVSDAEIVTALFSTNPSLDCSPYLIDVAVSPHDDLQIQTKSSYGDAGFPTDGGTFLVMSTGDPDNPSEADDVDLGPSGCDGDNAQITFTFDFPDVGGGVSAVQSMRFSLDFFSYEFPEFVGGGFNDYAYAYLDAPTPIPLDGICEAPIVPADGCMITFDAGGNPTNVDSLFFQACDVVGCDDPSGTPGWDTVNNGTPGDDAGRTGTLITCSPTECVVPVTPGVHTLTFIVGDAGDGRYTSVSLWDNLRCFGDLQCEDAIVEPPGGECATRLFGASHQGSSGPSTLWELDSTTGAPIGSVGPVGFNAVRGIDFHPKTGVLYGVGKRPVSGVSVLIRIDPDSGIGTEIGPTKVSTLGFGSAVTDLAFRNSDGKLYGYLAQGALVSFDLATGLASFVGGPSGVLGCCGDGLGFDRTDVLLHIDDVSTHEIDAANGMATPLAAVTYSGFAGLGDPEGNAIDYDPGSGKGYVSIDDGSGGSGPNYLATLNPLSGIVKHVGPTVDGLAALAWKSDCDDEDPCTQDVCKACEAPPASEPPLQVLTVDCDPLTSPDSATTFGPDNTMGMALNQVSVGGEFVVTEVTPQDFRALTPAELAQFNLIAVNNHPERISDDCVPGSAGLGTGWHSVIGVASGGRVALVSHDAARFHMIVPPFSPPKFTGLEPFGAPDLVRQAALWAGSGSRTGLLVFNDAAPFVGGSGWDNPELNLPAAWAITDLPAHTGQFADGGYTDVLPAFEHHPIYDLSGGGGVMLSDGRFDFRSISSFAANAGDVSFHSIFGSYNPGIFTPTEVVINSGVVDVGGLCPFCELNPVSAANGTPISIVREEATDCPPPEVFCELYGAVHPGGPGTPSTLYRIDPATGGAAPIGAIGFGNVSGIDFDPDTGVLYGSGDDPGSGLETLITIDTDTGAGTAVGPHGAALSGRFTDLSIRNADGTMFGFEGPSGGMNLHTIDVGSGLATLVGPSGLAGLPGNGLAFDAPDNLWHAADVDVDLMDQANGAAAQAAALTFVGFPSASGGRRINAMDRDPCTQKMLASVQNGGGGDGPNFLGEIDVASGLVTHLSQTIAGLDAVAWRITQSGDEGICCHVPVPDWDEDGLCDTIDPCPEDPEVGVGISGFQPIFGLATRQHFQWAFPTSFAYVRGSFTTPDEIGMYDFGHSGGGFGTMLLDPTLPSPGSVNGLWYVVRPECQQVSWESGGSGEVDCAPPYNPSDCCAAHASLGCSHPLCSKQVCAIDPTCCTAAAGWSAACVGIAAGIAECVDSCSGVQCRDGHLP